MADFGEILRNIGEFGLFQRVTLAALCFINFIQGFLLASFLFIEKNPDRHCNTDWILGLDPNLTTDEQLNLTLPREADGTFSRCQMFVPVDWDIDAIREFGLNKTTSCQNGWVYKSTLYKATIVTDFDLVCDKANLLEIIQAISMVGILLGSLLFGPLAESFGRKWAIQVPAVITFIFVLASGFCPDMYSFIVFSFFAGVGTGGYRVNCIVLTTEWIGASKRSWGVCLTLLFTSVGQCALAGLVYYIRDWRLVQIIIAAPLGVVLLYIWFIPESARWLLSRGRTEEAKQLIMKAAAINKRTIPDSLLENISVKKAVNDGGIKDIFRSRLLSRYFVTILLAWFSLNVSFYCLYLNMANLGLNVFLTQFIFGAIEIPAHILCIWLLEVFGRKPLFMLTLATAGLSSILILAVPQGCGIAVTSLAALSRFFLIWAAAVCVVLLQELFPTSIRQTVTGLGTISSKTGAIVAPLLNITAVYHWIIPIVVSSGLTFISGGLGFLLHETRRKELPDSTDEAEGNRNVTPTNKTPCTSSTKM
ncbi:solute carrier family 22 member 13-like [Sphaeramia orbicularis]|uniref:solute carrier family 22 member 13-like n=1 Tax=Sphaeramia orbicularis TaxID=375764 RepID=UPI0011814A53|nr:solute carrier family 22 member 13-like [Sphaeramia orbicularis]